MASAGNRASELESFLDIVRGSMSLHFARGHLSETHQWLSSLRLREPTSTSSVGCFRQILNDATTSSSIKDSLLNITEPVEPVHYLRNLISLMGTHDFSIVELTILKGCRNGVPSYLPASISSDTLYVGGSQGVVSVINPRMSHQERLIFSLLGDSTSNFVQKAFNWYASHLHQWDSDQAGSHRGLPFVDFLFEAINMTIFTSSEAHRNFSTDFGTSIKFAEHLAARMEDPSKPWAVEELLRTNWDMSINCILALQSTRLLPNLWRPSFLCMLDAGIADAFQYLQHLVVDPAIRHRMSLAKFFTFNKPSVKSVTIDASEDLFRAMRDESGLGQALRSIPLLLQLQMVTIEEHIQHIRALDLEKLMETHPGQLPVFSSPVTSVCAIDSFKVDKDALAEHDPAASFDNVLDILVSVGLMSSALRQALASGDFPPIRTFLRSPIETSPKVSFVDFNLQQVRSAFWDQPSWVSDPFKAMTDLYFCHQNKRYKRSSEHPVVNPEAPLAEPSSPDITFVPLAKAIPVPTGRSVVEFVHHVQSFFSDDSINVMRDRRLETPHRQQVEASADTQMYSSASGRP